MSEQEYLDCLDWACDKASDYLRGYAERIPDVSECPTYSAGWELLEVEEFA